MARPNFTRISGTTIARHAIRPPKLTATRWCKTCGGLHNGGCELVQIPGRTREGRPVNVPHYRRASIPVRRRRNRRTGEES